MDEGTSSATPIQVPSNHQPSWKDTKLSLERPYKDAKGAPIRRVYDIEDTGGWVYENPKVYEEQLGVQLQRIFEERGTSIWEDYTPEWINAVEDEQKDSITEEEESGEEGEGDDGDEAIATKKKPMTTAELQKLREDVIPNLLQALTEFTVSRDILSVYLKSVTGVPDPSVTPELSELPPRGLLSSVISRPGPHPSMQAYNAQLTLGWKDESLRESSNAFMEAASSMKRALASGERYWSDALKARNANWALVPAPFPGEFTSRRSTDNLAKDICISYGLENSPIDIRMASVAFLNTEDGKGPIATGDRRPTRLMVSIIQQNAGGDSRVSRSTFVPSDVEEEDQDVDTVITSLQREVVEREIFNALVTNASDLVTAPARALEKSLCVDISPTMELRFEQIYEEDLDPSPLSDSDPETNFICDIIYTTLQLLLIKLHRWNQDAARRHAQPRLPDQNSTIPAYRLHQQIYPERPLLLHPIVELLQYRIFTAGVQQHLEAVAQGISEAGIPAKCRFLKIGETTDRLVRMLWENVSHEAARAKEKTGSKLGKDATKGKLEVTGEAMLRLDDRQTIRFTLTGPSVIQIHLPQAISTVHSLVQLQQFLVHEINRCLLQHIVEIGRKLCKAKDKASWFSDHVQAKCVGAWEQTIMNFTTSFNAQWQLDCVVALKKDGQGIQSQNFRNGTPFFEWVEKVVEEALGA